MSEEPFHGPIERLEAEIARLRSELSAARDVLAQRDRALIAAHRAIEIAQADAAKLRWALDGTTRMMANRSENSSRAWRWAREIVAANQEVLSADHPGAAVLAELEAARAILATLRQHWHAGGEVWRSIDRDFEAYDAAVDART